MKNIIHKESKTFNYNYVTVMQPKVNPNKLIETQKGLARAIFEWEYFGYIDTNRTPIAKITYKLIRISTEIAKNTQRFFLHKVGNQSVISENKNNKEIFIDREIEKLNSIF